MRDGTRTVLSKRADPEAVRKISAQAGAARQLTDEVRAWESWATEQIGDYPIGSRGLRPTLAERLGRTSSLSKLSVRLNKAQAVAMNLMGVFAPLYRVQTEAGDKVFDVLAEYSRRNNLLVNVSSDGVIQVWNPDYTRKPLYKIHYTDDDQRRQRNNVLGVRLYEALQGR